MIAEIKLKKRYKYVGDIFQKLIGIGFNVETATDFLNEVADADVVPVVKCSQCRKRYTTECALWFSQLEDKQYFCGAIHNDDFYCSYGERKD